MKELEALSTNLSSLQLVRGAMDKKVAHIAFSHQSVQPGDLFVACVGYRRDGHDFIEQAIARGAVAILCKGLPSRLHAHLTYLQVSDTRTALGEVAAAFYDHPSRALKLVGITGTNGKTTTATLLHALFSCMGKKAGLLATTGYRWGTQVISAPHTTPDAVTINRLLREMLSVGCTHCFMEVSSHALVAHRVAGLHFSGGVFTNLTHDHLDFHETFSAYRDAKKMFFDALPSDAFALVNADDRNSAYLVQQTEARVARYALKSPASSRGRLMEDTPTGVCMSLWGQTVHFRLLGACNAYNLLAAATTAKLLGYEEIPILSHLSKVPPVRGRMDVISGQADDFAVLVDYAHTPDALEQVLVSLHRYAGTGQLITLVGCGGDRDREKRSKMGKIATRYSTHVVLTSDNPRSEPPLRILADMQRDFTSQEKERVTTLVDRREAIRFAIGRATPGDFVLLAGKGHEDYQELAEGRQPFSDYEVAGEVLGEKSV